MIQGISNIVNAINLLTKTMKCVSISCLGTLASFYLSATAPTTITVAGTFYKVAGTTVKNKAVDFTHSNNRLTYTGAKPVVVKIDVSGSFTSNTNNVTVKACPALNGVALTNAEIERKILVGTDIRGLSFHWEVELTTNDYLEVFITCDSAGAILTVSRMVALVG